jgi:hypothetical protein
MTLKIPMQQKDRRNLGGELLAIILSNPSNKFSDLNIEQVKTAIKDMVQFVESEKGGGVPRKLLEASLSNPANALSGLGAENLTAAIGSLSRFLQEAYPDPDTP